MHTVIISTGSNQGEREQHLQSAIEALEAHGFALLKASAVYETAAWGMEAQPAFLNQVLCVETVHKPSHCMELMLAIERAMGRQRQQKWGPRIIDLDILFYDHDVINESDLMVPHPYLHKRRFILQPLHEIMPDYIHPVLKLSVSEMLENCEDVLPVTLYQP
jgi:2-amino-4-hydroxy-6-hydroxymethyldihydropteridine diphosphokinase